MHKQKLPTPWDGVPGFWAAINRFFYPITGPAQLGAGHPEGPIATATTALCPMCGVSMAEHTRDLVADGRTLLHCPAPTPTPVEQITVAPSIATPAEDPALAD